MLKQSVLGQVVCVIEHIDEKLYHDHAGSNIDVANIGLHVVRSNLLKVRNHPWSVLEETIRPCSYSADHEEQVSYGNPTPPVRDKRTMLPATMLSCALLLGAVVYAQADCLGVMDPIVFYDMHDGDMKQITASGFVYQILPYNNSETWAVYGDFDQNCVSRVNFSVPGKPNPPPINLTMTMWLMESTDIRQNKMGFEFTDPTGQLAPPDQPLNFWTMDKWPKPADPASKAARLMADAQVRQEACLDRDVVVHDMHDGDEKELRTDNGALHITPYKNDQRWSVDAKFNDKCIASVNFQVPGKPSPPPVPLAAQVWGMASIAGADKNVLEFTDPSGTLASPIQPLNIWTPDNK